MKRGLLVGLLLGVSLPLLMAALPTLQGVGVGGTGVRTVANNAVLVGRGGSLPLVATAIPGCAKLGYNPTTQAFVCNETSTTTTTTTTSTTTTT